jgi:hypothetical protein
LKPTLDFTLRLEGKVTGGDLGNPHAAVNVSELVVLLRNGGNWFR